MLESRLASGGFDEIRGALRAYAYAVSGNLKLSDELISETIQLVQARSSDEFPNSSAVDITTQLVERLRDWSSGCADQLAMDGLLQIVALPPVKYPSATTIDDAVPELSGQAASRVVRALEEIENPVRRAAVLWHFLGDLPTRRIGILLGCDRRAAKIILHMGLRDLAARLDAGSQDRIVRYPDTPAKVSGRKVVANSRREGGI